MCVCLCVCVEHLLSYMCMYFVFVVNIYNIYMLFMCCVITDRSVHSCMINVL